MLKSMFTKYYLENKKVFLILDNNVVVFSLLPRFTFLFIDNKLISFFSVNKEVLFCFVYKYISVSNGEGLGDTEGL